MYFCLKLQIYIFSQKLCRAFINHSLKSISMLMRTIKYFITYLAFVKIINLEIFIRYTKLNIIKMNIRLLSKI